MTSIQTKSGDSEARTLPAADSPECSSFFVFHSPDVLEEMKLDIRTSRGSLHRPDENLHIEEIEARFLAASAAASEGYESQEAESNPNGSELKMESSNEDITWAFYPNSMQVGSNNMGSMSNDLQSICNCICAVPLRKATYPNFAIRFSSQERHNLSPSSIDSTDQTSPLKVQKSSE
jgi:hypothetical protein